MDEKHILDVFEKKTEFWRFISDKFFPEVCNVLKYFYYKDLPPHLQQFSAPFAYLAYSIASNGGDGPETVVALRKLLEAKDAAVRAQIEFTKE